MSQIVKNLKNDADFSEFRLICACCSVPQDRAARVKAALVPETDWDKLVAIAGRQRVAGLVFHALAGQMPEKTHSALAELARGQTILASRLALETMLVQRILHRAEIAVVFPKGTALARRIYGDLAARHSRDVDAFVRPEDMKAAHRALTSAGYQQIFPHTPFRDIRHVSGHSVDYMDPARKLLIELHWAFDENPTLDPCPGQPAKWTGTAATDMQCGPEGISTLNDTDLFCYLCLHGASHSWMRLKWLADIAAFVPQLDDLAGLIEIARARGLIRPVASALILTRDLLGWDMPAEISARLPDSPALRKLTDLARRALSAGGGSKAPYDVRFGNSWLFLARFWLSPRPAYVWHEMRSLLGYFFSPEYNRDIPPKLYLFFPLIRIFRWIRRNSRRTPALMAPQERK